MDIDNDPLIATFTEISTDSGKSKAQIEVNKTIKNLDGWISSNNGQIFTKEFSTPVSYIIPIEDFYQNTSQVLVDIKNASDIILNYGTFDLYSYQTLVNSGQISSPNTISSGSNCKIESLLIRLSGNTSSNLLQGRTYVHTYWGDGAYDTCVYRRLTYYHGYNPHSDFNDAWLNIGLDNTCNYSGYTFSQFGGAGSNRSGRPSSVSKPIPTNIANQYLHGISGIQFKLQDNSDFSVVYQGYVNGIGWLKASSDGEENVYRHDKPFSSFRINLVPKSEKQYLIDFWNCDIGTNNVN